MTVEANGAPFDQGLAQGLCHRDDIVRATRSLRRRYGPLAWYGARRRAHAAAGRSLQRFLPQMHERLRGIAAGARVSPEALELYADMSRVQGVASVAGSRLEARLDLSPELVALLGLRRSAPDAVGFATVELTAAPLAGCLACVNEEGVAVAVVEERGGGPSMRCYAQDLGLRVQSAETAITHLRLRAQYAGGSGVLVLVEAAGRALRLVLDQGALTVEGGSAAAPGAGASLVLDAAAGTLSWAGQTLSVGHAAKHASEQTGLAQ